MITLASALARLHARGVTLPEGRAFLNEFGDSPELSARLVALIRDGGKRATCMLAATLEAEGETAPAPGDLGVVVDHGGEPALVTRVTAVSRVAFRDVGAEFAAKEAEGDGSLEHWRRGHRAYFERECARLGIAFDESLELVCEEFELVTIVPPARGDA